MNGFRENDNNAQVLRLHEGLFSDFILFCIFKNI